jgi:hypothetical protein
MQAYITYYVIYKSNDASLLSLVGRVEDINFLLWKLSENYCRIRR